MAMNFVVCVSKQGLDDLSGDDLAIGHVYEALGETDQHGFIRIVDQSGEDYLYPATCFEPVSVSDQSARRLHDAPFVA